MTPIAAVFSRAVKLLPASVTVKDKGYGHQPAARAGERGRPDPDHGQRVPSVSAAAAEGKRNRWVARR